MKKSLRTAFIFVSVCLALVYILASFSAFIPPSVFSYSSLLAIAFPYLLLLMLLVTLLLFFIRKKWGFIFLLLIFIGYRNIINTFAFNAGKWEMKKSSPTTLRIMTWNVEGFVSFFPIHMPEAAKRVKMLNAITEYNPDILCVQEYRNIENSPWAASIRKELDSLGYHYHYYSNDSVQHLGPKLLTQIGVAIYSKFNYADSNTVNISKLNGTENLISLDFEWQQKKFRLFTAHLLSFSIYRDTAKASAAGQDIYEITYHRKRFIQGRLREVEKDHAQEVITIRKTLEQSPYPVIYCGDINSTPASYTYRKLKGNLQDAFLKKGFGIGTTFPELAPSLRIDVCLPDKKFEVLQCTIPPLELSDHYPVISDIRWKE